MPPDEWDKFKRGVKKLRPRRLGEAPPRPRLRIKPAAPEIPPLALPSGAAPAPLDPALRDRLSKGALRWEARLDLHHMDEDAAHAAITRFLAAAQAARQRTLLIVTGKGAVLRRAVPHWLTNGPFAAAIRGYEPAAARDGGDGALYVVLRKMR